MADFPPILTRHPARDWEDALITGNGRVGALAHATADRTALTLGHERLFLPVSPSLPAPETARILPELRSLLRRGRSREAAERITAFAAAEDPGYAETRWIDPLVGAAVLRFAPTVPEAGTVPRRCAPDTGVVTERLPDGTVHRVFASRAPDAADAVVAEFTRPGSGGLDGLLRLTLLDEEPPVPVSVDSEIRTDRFALRVGFPERPPGTLPGYAVTCEVSARGGRVEAVPDGLRVRGVERLVVVARVLVGVPGEAEPPPVEWTESPIADFDEHLARHRRVHGELMSRFRVHLGAHGPEGFAYGGRTRTRSDGVPEPVAAEEPAAAAGSGGAGGAEAGEPGLTRVPEGALGPEESSAPDRAPGPEASSAPDRAPEPEVSGAPGGAPEPGATGEELLAAGATPELVARLVDAGRYAIVSSCGDLPPTLQGVWSGTYDPPWRSGYTFDGNLPSAVAALHATGTPELMLGLFDLLDGMVPDLAENARRLYGCRGLLLPPHASTGGRHNHFGPEWCLTCWTSGAAWMARLYWDHYSHTRDRAFLRERALPFLTAAAEFHEDFLTDDGFVPSYSPENTPADGDGQAAVNATLDVAAVRDLTRNLVRAHRELALPGTRRWLRLAARVPGYRISDAGELAEWAGPAGPVQQRDQHAHRHASHLFALWYEPDPAFADPRLRAAAVRTVRSRLSWWRGQESDEMAFGLVQLGLAAARLGLAEEAHETLALLATRYWRPTLVSTHNRGALFNVDISGGFPAVVAAMLVGSTEGRVDLLPALPRAWPTGRVEGLRARGGVIVDRLEWGSGTGTALLRSVEPRTVRIGFPAGAFRSVRTGPRAQVRVRFRLFSEPDRRSASKILV
ncbi:glycosyl hydrolase family 65 [Nocardiopsis sp. Huas11]|uniref:glycosyl hydrolase family 95 catalytic domain-containing protein n=1 Tax=Nocardiopsis sp. Huas11 TaxID=2183912 RepID=UPI000F14DEF8|nr:glycoside hydrolase N-terminal domain-containing protein [Nocardiopsis sp. Huas11]RKS06155.1 glycosyl hydrolase family 65 [Nocardiopsis sp. Huas11]